MITMGTLLIPDAEIIIPNRLLSMRVPSDVDDSATGRIPGLVGMAWPTSRFEPQAPYDMAESHYSIIYRLFGTQSCSLPCAEDHIEPSQRLSDGSESGIIGSAFRRLEDNKCEFR